MKFNEEFLRRAIRLGESGLGLTFPNPIVGALILDREGNVLGEGYHAGGSHAEILAILDAKSKGHSLQGATLYCSLEPCNHFGNTPPCTDAIIESGISSVYFALSDPNAVAAGGAAKLRGAGLLVKGELLLEEAAYSNRAWLTKIATGRPRMTAKIAQSLDGRVAAADGQSKWITSEASRAHAKRLRDGFDAICIGTGTALADNPSLRGANRNPARFVIGNRPLPNLLLDSEEGYHRIETHNINVVIEEFALRGFNSVLIEGGPMLLSALLEADIIDEIHLYMAGSIMGSGKRSIEIPEFKNFSQQLHYGISSLSIIDNDIFATYLKREIN